MFNYKNIFYVFSESLRRITGIVGRDEKYRQTYKNTRRRARRPGVRDSGFDFFAGQGKKGSAQGGRNPRTGGAHRAGNCRDPGADSEPRVHSDSGTHAHACSLGYRKAEREGFRAAESEVSGYMHVDRSGGHADQLPGNVRHGQRLLSAPRA